MSLSVIQSLEANVRAYSRVFPTVFSKAKGSWQWNTEGQGYLDFFCGAGALNYGHNEDRMKAHLLSYIEQDFVTHSLDMATPARAEFLQAFQRIILQPRGMNYKLQIPGPTGTNVVEAAFKVARKATGRSRILAFEHGYHGMTLGALAATGNPHHRNAAGVELRDIVTLPYESEKDDTSLEQLMDFLQGCSGEELPAAAIIETVQGEGGLFTASFDWLQRLQRLLHEYKILLIVDDIQAGCGRTGTFFSFEPAGLSPDMVVLSKSLSGYGLPLSMLMLRPELDVWKPGEHSGTFRGFNPALVTAKAALELYWADDSFARQLQHKISIAHTRMEQLVDKFVYIMLKTRGRGLMLGVNMEETGLGPKLQQACFRQGLMAVTAGHQQQVLKLLPPLTASIEELHGGFDRLTLALEDIL